jgi:nicotinamidase-related amidase
MNTAGQAADTGNLLSGSAAFLEWLQEWQASLPVLDLRALLDDTGIRPEDVALVSADLVEGFCYHGPLASPRIADVVGPSVKLMERAYELGVRRFALVQEYHTHDATEFHQFGPHCIRGTDEADTVESIRSLPFADLFTLILKNSLHPALHTDMDSWLAERPETRLYLTVGDCTDLCLYQLVMHLKLEANAENRNVSVVVPANCVQTYDLPVSVAQSIDAMPHDGDLMHAIFLYHMALNGAQVVREVI